MRIVYVNVVGAGISDPVMLDRAVSPFQVTLEVQAFTGAINATVQYTMDDIYSGVSPLWTAHADLTNVTVKSNGTIISPVTAVRLINADAGTARLVVQQAGIT